MSKTGPTNKRFTSNGNSILKERRNINNKNICIYLYAVDKNKNQFSVCLC